MSLSVARSSQRFLKKWIDLGRLSEPFSKASFLHSVKSDCFQSRVSSQVRWASTSTEAMFLRTAFSKGKQTTSVQCKDDQGLLEVAWEDGQTSEFPYVWLRDNCLCQTCFNPHSLARYFAMKNLDLDIRPRNSKADPERKTITISWTDDHESIFPISWLEGRNFDEEKRKERVQFLGKYKPKTWGSELQEHVPNFKFHEILNDDMTLYKWIRTLEETGLSVVTDTPCEISQLDIIGNRVANLRTTNYGKTFRVKAKDEPSNLAYTSGELGYHSDLAYFSHVPGVQMLHCIEQDNCEGGENQLADGFHGANILKERHPDLYEILTTTLIDYNDVGTDAYKFYLAARHPVICEDLEGNLKYIAYHNMGRDSFFNVPLEKVTKLYRAIKTYNSILYEPENHIIYKPKAGDIAIFDNTRIFHGRSEYKIGKDGGRHLEGGYIDWDEMSSKKRVLMVELNIMN